jgi:hypothetical protein
MEINYCKFLLPFSRLMRIHRANNTNTPAQPSSSSSSSSSSSKKGHKGTDPIDSLISQYGTSPPLLPHNEFLEEFIQKLRKKLKFVDEASSAVKFTRSDLQNRNTSVPSRAVVNAILSEVDILELLKAKQLFSCNYLSEIKSQVHSPLTSLLNKYSQLPALMDATELSTAAQQLHSHETAYNALRSCALFQHIASQKQEAEFIESEVNEMLRPLRQAAKTITKLSNVRRESVWSRILLPLLACPTGELMARCCHQ